MGEQIHEEVEHQIRYLDELDQDVDRTGAKLKVANNRIKKM
jgi:regulator of vacuolar morphogenesis